MDYTQSEKADMLVLGSRGMGSLKRTVRCPGPCSLSLRLLLLLWRGGLAGALARAGQQRRGRPQAHGVLGAWGEAAGGGRALPRQRHFFTLGPAVRRNAGFALR